jgi:hypothetical protein
MIAAEMAEVGRDDRDAGFATKTPGTSWET